ncbi:MAG: hypothetical protein COB67_08315 [SAR324 cluster bacterium]|uniref:Uncharacterized protein n=1 Tax=SAR324 cluster bacterium TaxID=2024889 RepID=A0A2A4T307_9DELT|nr:MAG: hypothetical protein COB67_08315 [SAR324 cluster bacterium]
MLKFYGIRFNQQGVPERYTLSFDLKESLNASLHIHDYFGGKKEEALTAIDEEINRQYQPSNPIDRHSKAFRYTVAKWFRTKDIANFLFQDEAIYPTKLEVAKVLNTGREIEEKWLDIEQILLKHLSKLSIEEREQLINNCESGFHKILQMITLFFLEQDEEQPPANLELQFLRNQFPRVIWKKKQGIHGGSDPFWQPQNLFCRVSYLITRILSRSYLNERALQPVPVQNPIPQAVAQPIIVNNCWGELLPQKSPDRIQVSFAADNQAYEQLSLLPETVPETLLSLQKIIQKKYSHEGVKHFLGILRQFSTSKGGFTTFNTYKHLQLVTRLSKKGRSTDRQYQIFCDVFQSLMSLQVSRVWEEAEDDEMKETQNSFILEVGREYTGKGKRRSVKKYMLDPLFAASPENPFRLGLHLQLIPNELFRESTHKHSLLTGISSYLAGTWLNEFPQNRGVMKKTARQIIEGCAFNITPSNRYRIRRKLNSELAFMEEKNYIGNIRLTHNTNGNPWEDLYEIEASDYFRKKLQSFNTQKRERLVG